MSWTYVCAPLLLIFELYCPSLPLLGDALASKQCIVQKISNNGLRNDFILKRYKVCINEEKVYFENYYT